MHSSINRRLNATESAEKSALLSESEVLLSSTLVRRHNDCLTPTLFLGLPPEEGRAAPGAEISGWGHLMHPATNDSFGAAFQTDAELIEASIRYHTPPFLLLGMYVRPQTILLALWVVGCGAGSIGSHGGALI